ncbi:MAG: bifunctional serine/threonine-protein kinase/formylglycine-generating enzyme family protein [Bryobacteraceae bacterium]
MSQIGRYQVTALLGEGGMGTVYRATDPQLRREVAIKLIRREVVMDPSVRQRFDHEAIAAGMLNHRGIVTVYDRGEENGQPFIVMELVEGRTLETLLPSGEMTVPRVLSAIKQVAAALDYAHSRNVIHRDIKPPNIILERDGTAKIMDFGIARVESVGSSLTTAGMMAGSPHYVPPERYMSGAVSGYTDQWALAVTAYQALTGRTPFHADTWDNLTYQICHQPAPDPRQFRAELPEGAAAALTKALAKRPEERFPSCTAFAEALETGFAAPTATVTPQRSYRMPLVAGAVVGLVLAAAVAWFTMKPGPVVVEQKADPKVETKSAVSVEPPAGMVLVPAGEARLGEKADRVLTLPAFYIDKTEVSAGDFRRFCEQTGRAVPSGMPESQMPAINVTWDDASAFAAWAGKRLPAALEWEKAARGASGQALPWGAAPRGDAANIPVDAASAAKAAAAPVDGFASGAGPYGAVQMLGNVWEWTSTAAPAPPPAQLDRYRRIFQDLSPPLSGSDTFYQVRGGSFRYEMPLDKWSALVWDFNPTPARARRNDVGFRCAKDP